jgi:hypothetical protein
MVSCGGSCLAWLPPARGPARTARERAPASAAAPPDRSARHATAARRIYYAPAPPRRCPGRIPRLLLAPVVDCDARAGRRRIGGSVKARVTSESSCEDEQVRGRRRRRKAPSLSCFVRLPDLPRGTLSCVLSGSGRPKKSRPTSYSSKESAVTFCSSQPRPAGAARDRPSVPQLVLLQSQPPLPAGTPRAPSPSSLPPGGPIPPLS